jgi:hypothetical protein
MRAPFKKELSLCQKTYGKGENMHIKVIKEEETTDYILDVKVDQRHQNNYGT